MEGRRIATAMFRECLPCLVGVLMVLAPSRLSGQNEFVRTRDMLQELRSERNAALKSGQAAEFTTAYLDRRLSAVGEVLNAELGSALSGETVPNCGSLQQDLRRSLGVGGEPDPNVASVLCIRRDTGTYEVVTYALAAAAIYSRSWLGVFGPSAMGHHNQLLASVDNPLPGKTVALAGLPDGEGGAVRFLAYGINWGDAHNRLTVLAYQLRARRLEAVWSRTDLAEGQVKVEGGKIHLSFVNSALGPGHQSVHIMKESYRVTSVGIRLQ